MIDHKLFRSHCILRNSSYVKDLRIFKNRDLRHIVIVDNSIVSFFNQLNNGIHVSTYFGDINDTVLLSLLPFLQALAATDNIQTELRKTIGLPDKYAMYLQSKQRTSGSR